MTQSIDAAKDKLVADFNAVIADTEQLLKSLGAVSGEEARAMRASVEENLAAARRHLGELEESTSEFVRANPWQSIGIAAAIGAIAGVFLGLMLNRR